MTKRKSSTRPTSQDVKTQNEHNAEMEVDNIDLSVISLSNKAGDKEKKDVSNLGDISHKNISGENNWQTFLKLSGIKSKGLRKPGSKTNLSHQPNEVNSDDSVTSPKKSKNINLKRTIRSDEQVLGLTDKSVTKVKRVQKPSKTIKPVLTKQIAIDCEMVGVEVGVNNSMLAKVSLVNAHGDCVYDKYVKPTEPVLDYRTWVSGIRPQDLENGCDFKTVQKEVADIIKDKILVGHALHNDLRVLFLSHPYYARRDTAVFKGLREGPGPIPSLKTLAKKYLGVTIQDGEHSSQQDALAAMQLYKMFKKEWEKSFHPKKLGSVNTQQAKKLSVSSAPKTNTKNKKSKKLSASSAPTSLTDIKEQ